MTKPVTVPPTAQSLGALLKSAHELYVNCHDFVVEDQRHNDFQMRAVGMNAWRLASREQLDFLRSLAVGQSRRAYWDR